MLLPMASYSKETLVASALHWVDERTGSLVPPIVNSTTFARDDMYQVREERSYSRDHNPTGEPAEKMLAQLEYGAAAMLFPSGMSAATAVFRSLCAPGDHCAKQGVLHVAQVVGCICQAMASGGAIC
jgi:cystathionine gamma-synthase